MQEYPIQIITRAMELYRYPVQGRLLTLPQIAKQLGDEFSGCTVTGRTVGNWAKERQWVRGGTPVAGGVVDTEGLLTLAQTSLVPLNPEAFDWQAQKLKFIAELCGLADSTFAIVKSRAANGAPGLMFRDAESALKSALAMIELAGKLQSGKLDADTGDNIPALTELHVTQIIQYYTQGGPAPKLPKKADVIEGAISNADSE